MLFTLDMFTSFPSIFVITFFVLSGFFIARSLEKKCYAPLLFYGDRVIRIYIPYIGSLLISFLALYYAFKLNPDLITIATNRPYNLEIVSAYNDLNIHSFFNAIFFLSGESGFYFGNNNPSWSLYYEALFYIFIPFILIYLKKYWFLTLALILHILSIFYHEESLLFSFFTNYLIYFATGVTLYQIANKKETRYFLLKNIRRFTDIIIIFSIIFLFSSIPVGILHMQKLGFFLGMIGTILMICWVLYGRRTTLFKLVNTITINKLSHFLGKISFSIYLIHVPIFVFIYSVLVKYTGEIVFYERIYWIAVLLVIPIGYINYLIFEKNSLILLQRYKNKFSNSKKG